MRPRQVVRGVAAFLVGVATFYFVGWMGSALLSAFLFPALAGLLGFAGGASCAFLSGRWIWRSLGPVSPGKEAPGPLGSIAAGAVTGALLLGGIGFVGGFFGPLIFAPGANQGPLLGLLITGPAGVVLGAVGGGVYGLMCTRRAAGVRSVS